MGPGLGGGIVGTVEVGTITSFNPSDLEGLGLAVNAFAAAGPKGMTSQIFGSMPGSDSSFQGGSAGYAVGGGFGVSGLGTYTWKGGQVNLNELPEAVSRSFESYIRE